MKKILVINTGNSANYDTIASITAYLKDQPQEYPVSYEVKGILEVDRLDPYQGIILSGRRYNDPRLDSRELKLYLDLYDQIMTKNIVTLAICGGHQRICAAEASLHADFDLEDFLLRNGSSGKTGFYPISLSDEAKRLDILSEVSSADGEMIGFFDHNFSITGSHLSNLNVGGYFSDAVTFVYGPGESPHVFSFQSHPESRICPDWTNRLYNYHYDPKILAHIKANYHTYFKKHPDLHEGFLTISPTGSDQDIRKIVMKETEEFSREIFNGFLRETGI